MKNVYRARVGTYQRSRKDSKPVGRIWPNGEFTLGYGVEGEEGTRAEEWSWTGGHRGLTEEELDVRLECLDGWLDAVAAVYSVSARLACLHLTLSDTPNSHRSVPRPKYGLKGLTGKGRKMIRSGAYLLEKKLGKDDVVMITLTVPTLSRPERIAVAKQWGHLTNRLVQYLSRALEQQGRPAAIIGCVEVQTGRLKKYSEGYLHLHLVCPAHSNAGRTWAIDASDLRSWWKAAIERVTKTTLAHLPRVETAIVEKSVEAYLAKYLSKGSDEGMAEFVDDLGEECVPGQWWFCSAPMRDAIRKNTLSGDNCGALLESLVEHLLEMGTGEGFEYIRHVDRLVDGKLKTCGWVGRLTPETRAEIELMLCPF
jgi:hypothetical protein